YNINFDLYKVTVLGPYVTNPKVYKCPNDTIPSDNGDRIRSISMNPGLLGDMPESIKTSMSSMIGGWQLFRKTIDLSCIGVANCWVFCDESMWSLNDGYLECNIKPVGAQSYPDCPAKYDCGGNCFSFADGHVEY